MRLLMILSAAIIAVSAVSARADADVVVIEINAGIGIKAADLALRGFSRAQETDADQFGLAIVNAEYGHVNEAWRLFERWKIGETSHLALITYFSTHPDTGDRIVDLENFAAAERWREEGEVTCLRW